MYVCFGIVKWNEGWAECKFFDRNRRTEYIGHPRKGRADYDPAFPGSIFLI